MLLMRGLGEVAKTLTTEILLKNQTIKPQSEYIGLGFLLCVSSKITSKAQLDIDPLCRCRGGFIGSDLFNLRSLP